MSDCIFCKIVSKDIPADVVYEDDKVIAIKDINPQAPVHILVIPREHIPTVNDIKDFSIVGHVYQVIQKLAKEFNIDQSGYRVVVNCQENAGQSVFHLHFHLLGGRIFRWPPG